MNSCPTWLYPTWFCRLFLIACVAMFACRVAPADAPRSVTPSEPSPRPVIGIASLPSATYVRAIRRCGGVPVVRSEASWPEMKRNGPALTIGDLMQHDFSGNGVISLLSAGRLLQQSPRVYAAFLMWLLAELFEELPEAGDLTVPKMVLFFDEAHLLFDGMPKALLDKIEQVVRLIRSKGVGVYFVTQSPLDLPPAVLGQLGLKVQHALRAFTPADQKALRSVVAGFRQDSSFDVAAALTQMGLGEALVSTLQPDGTPSTVQRTLIRPPESRIGPVTAEERATLLARSPLKGRYDTELDRESAYELLARRAEEAAARAKAEELAAAQAKAEAEAARAKPRGRQRQGIGEALLKSAARSVGRSLGNRLVRGLLGSLLK